MNINYKLIKPCEKNNIEVVKQLLTIDGINVYYQDNKKILH